MKKEAVNQKALEMSLSWVLFGHMPIDAQSKFKHGKVWAALDATKIDLKSGKWKVLTQTVCGR